MDSIFVKKSKNGNSLFRFSLAALFTISFFCSVAQPRPPEPWLSRDKFFWGGNIGGISFSNRGTFIDVSPLIGYRVTEKLAVGIGAIYQYISQSGLNAHNFGGKPFARYIIWRGLFAHAEYELMNIKYFYQYTNGDIFTERRWVGSVFLGGGYQQKMGQNSAIYLMALYNFNHSKYSPRLSPVYFTMGIGIGI